MPPPATTRRTLAAPTITRPAKAPRTPGYVRRAERRWRSASFYLVERRKGKLWMYGSIALAIALWAYVYLFVQFGV
jgi:hypothetical protein